MQHLGFLRGLPRVTDAPSSETQLLLRQRAERAPQPMSPRQFGTEATAALLFALAALALAVADHDGLDVGLAIALTIGLAAVQRVEFVVGSGYTVPTPLVFVPMLFALPAGIVPVCVAVAMVLDRMPDVLRGRRHGERLVVSVADAWFSLGPAIVFALAEPGAPVLGD